MENSKNYFHVFKDSETDPTTTMGAFNSHFGLTLDPNYKDITFYFWKVFLTGFCPRMHAMLSGAMNFGYTHDSASLSNYEKVLNIAKGGFGAITGFYTPTLKFRFAPEDILGCIEPEKDFLDKVKDFFGYGKELRMQNDPDYNNLAYRTRKAISPLHLGITGSLVQGINAGVFNRMTVNPMKVSRGVAMLGLAVVVGRATYRYIKQPAQPIEKSQELKTRMQKIKAMSLKCAKLAAKVTVASTLIFLNTL